MARDGFQLFHREWANIQAGLNRVSKNSVEGEKAAELFNSYMVAGAELLPLHYFPKDCRSFLETGLKVSQRLSQKNIEALHLLNLGAFHNSQKKYEEAEECLDQAQQLASTLKDAQTEGKALNEMARLYLTKNKTEEAIDILLKKRKLCQENKIEIDEEISLMRLGLAYEKKGEFDKAIQTMKDGKRKAKEAGNGPCMGTLLKHIGFCLGGVQNLSAAEDYLEASLLLARGLGKRKEELEILLHCGEIYAQSKDVEQALNLLEEGLELAEKYRDNRYEGLFLVQIGDTYTRMQEKQKAAENFMKSLDPLKKAKELLLIGEINLKLSQSFELDNEESSKSKSTSTARTNNRRTAASVMSFSFAFMPWKGTRTLQTESIVASQTKLLFVGPTPSGQFLIKIVDGHSGIKNQTLGIDATCAFAQQKYRCIGRLLSGQTFFPQCCLFGMQVGIDIAGYARRGRCLEQAWIDGVEPDL